MHLCAIANIESIHVKKLLKYTAASGHRVDVITFDKAEIEGVTIHIIKTPSLLRSRKLRYLYCVIAARKLVREIKPDILLSIYLIGPGGLGARCSYHPHVVMAIGSDVLLEMKRSFYNRLITKSIIKRTDRFITVSKAVADKLVERGVYPENIFTNPIGVDSALFNYSEDSDKKGKLQIVSTRKLDPLYNVKQFINSLPGVIEKHEGFDVVIIGTGSEYKSIKRSIDSYGVKENVKLVGNVSQSDLVNYLKKSHIYISMSLSDGAPVSLFEAMACGCFPILSDIQANRDWIKDGINGFLIPLGNHELLVKRILEAMESPSLVNKAKLTNRQIVEERLDFSKTSDNLIQYLDSIIKSKTNNN